MRENQHLVGAINELGLLHYLQKNYPHLIFRTTSHFSPEDMKGHDIIGYDFMSRPVYFVQCKSSEYKASEFKITHPTIHTFYPTDETWAEVE